MNPRAWDKGTVFLQCEACGAWHKVADAAGLVEEVRFPENAPLARRSEGAPPAELEFEDAPRAIEPRRQVGGGGDEV